MYLSASQELTSLEKAEKTKLTSFFELCKNLDNAITSMFKNIKSTKVKKITILLSPASASYDHFKNFEERGNKFKKLTMNYARRYF